MFPRNVSCYRLYYSFCLHCLITKTQREKDKVQGFWSKDFLFLEQCSDFQGENYRRCIHLSKKIIHHVIISSFLCIQDVFCRKLSEASTNIKIVSRSLQTSLTQIYPSFPFLVSPFLSFLIQEWGNNILYMYLTSFLLYLDAVLMIQQERWM